MRFENIDNIEFYTLESDEKKIYAEYMVSSDDGALPDVYKLICINDPAFTSYLRLVVIPNIKNKTTANKIIRDIQDYINVYGCTDNIKTKIRTAGKLRNNVIEYAYMTIYKDMYVLIQKVGISFQFLLISLFLVVCQLNK